VIQREERVERKDLTQREGIFPLVMLKWNGFDARRRISPSSRRNGKDSMRQEGYPPSSRQNGKDSTRQERIFPLVVSK